MLQQSDVGILFRPPENVIKDYPQLPVVQDYEELKKILVKYI
jgi:phosphoserine/homoserine phosphotransferase